MESPGFRIDPPGAGEGDTRGLSGGGCRVDAVIARLATRQRGVVERRQLRAAGISRHQIDRRLRTGALLPLHRGVYAVGHAALHPHAHLVAALLASGPGSAISHDSAAVLDELVEDRNALVVHVTRDGAHRDSRRGIVLHRAALAAADLRRLEGLPVTSLARTLLDLAATAPELLPRALNEARIRRPADVRRLVIPKHHRGARVLAELLANDDGFTRSEAERRLLGLLRRAGLPRPRTNAKLLGFEVDALWPEHRLVIEVDGYAYHGARDAFERDRARDQALLAAGYRVLRLTRRQLTEHPESTLVHLVRALA